MSRMTRFIHAVAAAALLLAACAPAEPAEPANKLATILARGTLIIATDPAYPPQSELNPNGQRPADTKCTADQVTAAELTGFDIDTAAAIAAGLGVEPCFVSPDWTLITAGSWSDRWDVSVGSMTVTPERMQALYFAQPYYTTPAAIFVHKDNTSLAGAADLAGKNIGVCTGCTYEAYLNSTLAIPGEDIQFVIKGATVKGYDTDSTALEDLALGDGVRLDAVITAQPTGLGYISDGKPVKQIGDALYYEYLAPAIDKQSSQDPVEFVKKVSEVVLALHKDGTLKALSLHYYNTDLTTAAGAFDLDGLKQLP